MFKSRLVLMTAFLAAGLLPTHTAQAAVHKVELRDIEFHPNRLQVKSGDTIHFVNKDPFDHDVYLVRSVNRNLVLFPATTIPSGVSVDVPVKDAGIFDLYCTIHGGMEGKVSTTGLFTPSAAEQKKYKSVKGIVPPIAKKGEKLFWGKAQCYQCHMMDKRGTGLRGPNLKDIGFRSGVRAKKLGLSSGTQYLVQSILHPEASIVEGYTNDMATVYQAPINLNAGEIKKIVTYLQSQGGEVDEWAIDIDESVLSTKPSFNPFKGGDPQEGKVNFKKYGCSKCHTVGDQEAMSMGPNLTEIGAYRTWAWLAESLLDPNAEIGKNWKNVTVHIKEGESITGILKSESSKKVKIQVSKQEIKSIPKNQVVKIVPLEQTRMPANYGEFLTFQEIGDFISYLQSLRTPPNTAGKNQLLNQSAGAAQK